MTHLHVSNVEVATHLASTVESIVEKVLVELPPTSTIDPQLHRATDVVPGRDGALAAEKHLQKAPASHCEQAR